MDSCGNCRYKEEWEEHMVCTYELHENNGCPEELPETFWCEDFKKTTEDEK